MGLIYMHISIVKGQPLSMLVILVNGIIITNLNVGYCEICVCVCVVIFPCNSSYHG